MKVDQDITDLCSQPLSTDSLKNLREFIKNSYIVHW